MFSTSVVVRVSYPCSLRETVARETSSVSMVHTELRTLHERMSCSTDLQDKIEIIEGKLEDMDSIRGAPFDVIVSEWMGYGLFFESMLDTVLYARDKYLKPDGIVTRRVLH